MSSCYQELIEKLSQSLWTPQEFNAMLQQYAGSAALKSIALEITGPELEQGVYGETLTEQPKVDCSLDSQDSAVQIRCRIWAEQTVDTQIQMELSQIMRSYLHLPRASGCLLPFYGNTGIKEKCHFTLRRFLDQGYIVAVFMVDLDHFKDINDQYDHATGSSVLVEFSELLRQQCQSAIAIHRSGDEFFILMPCVEISAPLNLAYQIGKVARTHSYRVGQGIALTAAQGICLCQNNEISFEQAIKYAEDAYNPKTKNEVKKRDSVRMVCPGNPRRPRGEENRQKAFAIVKTHLDCNSLFKNPYLDFLSFFAACRKDEHLAQDEIDNAIKWIAPSGATGMQLLGKSNMANYQCEWSQDELAFALFHGFCRNNILGRNRTIKLHFYEEMQGFTICLDDVILYSSGEKNSAIQCETYSLNLPEKGADQYVAKKTVLIQIGYQDLPVPEDCFDCVIRIDSRATIGGNLPDFWAAALSELIEVLWNKPFLEHVLVCGKREHGKTFYDILERCSQWGEEPYSFSFLAKKIRQPIEHIQSCQKRLAKAVQFIKADDNKHLISTLANVCQEDSWCQHVPHPFLDTRHRFLNRSLSFEKIRLGINDGCVVDTMEEAFPTVLEIIRNCPVDNYLDNIQDQAGRVFRELPNFKVVIKRPNSKHIPEYYEEEKAHLETYYQSVFGDEDGFFQKHLREKGQYEAVLRHIGHLITKDGVQYATRRAILVVPHIIDNPEDLTPLGLVSVYIAPRMLENDVILDFTFTWRTVEAMVGFPYSLYGSVKYAEKILKSVYSTCSISQEKQLKMGTLSYLAYSFHMFLDKPYTQIIRGIINDASI